MKKLVIVFALATVAMLCGGASDALAQTPSSTATQTDPGITANGVIGEVAAVDAGAKQMFVKTDAGSVVVVATADNTIFMRVPPGESTLDKAARITLAEVSAGDRVFARGKPSADNKSVAARMVIVNTKADLTQKQERERAEWKQRGVVGVITALNAQTKEITLQTRGAAGAQAVVVAGTGETKFRRYAPDSVKFSDAKPGTFEQLQVGDQLRAKGDKSADGARFTAEEIVTGSFRTVIGTITAVAADQNVITIKTLQGNQPLTVVVSKDSMLKRIPAEFAAMMGGGGGAAGGSATPSGGVVVRQGTPPSGAGSAAGEGGRRVMRGGGDMQEMLERLPSTTVAELEPGRMILFSTTGTDAARVTAIQLVAGVEPLIAMMQGRPGGAGRGAGGGGGSGAGGGGITFGFGIGAP